MINMNCPLCEGHLFEGDACGTCHAPAAVIESLIYRECVPKFVGVLGPSGVGKTVYLGMLLDEIVVKDNEATLTGSYTAIAETLHQTKMDRRNQVPTFMRDWRARRDSNSLPLGS